MCGIAGIYYFDKKQNVDKKLLKRMTDVISYRGPDNEGFFIDKSIGLGVRRLKIIDLKTGNQPIHNEDGSVWIVYNGEIYNFQEIKEKLEKKGHRFYTKTDTEVIVHAYEEWGEKCVNNFNGMWAFALWDSNKKKLFLSKDRIGKKPLYYAIFDGALIFGSEIKSILQTEIKREVDLKAIHHYLTYLYVPPPLTGFKGIKKLLPATNLTCKNGIISLKKYWELNFNNKIQNSESFYIEKILGILKDSVNKRLISDVPLGALLSGGIDSGTIVGIMSKLNEKPVETFSIGFENKDFSELNYARVIADFFETNHHEFIVKANVINLLPKIIWHYDEPYADSSAIPTYYVSKIARKYVTVALNGDGGDESFVGYEWHPANRIANYYKMLPSFIKLTLSKIILKLPESTKMVSLSRGMRRFVQAADLPPKARFYRLKAILTEEMKTNMYSMKMKKITKDTNSLNVLIEYFNKIKKVDFLSKSLYVDIKTYLCWDLLVKADRASMANSLEVRSPFLDYRLMEFAARIPSNVKLKRLTTKYILRKAVKDILPKKIIERRKQGFNVPVGSWFKKELKDIAEQILFDERTKKRELFNFKVLKGMWDKHINNKIDYGHALWALLSLELWHRLFIDNKNLYKPKTDLNKL